MSNNATNVRPVFRDSLGNPRANGLVYFYDNKTLTLASIYSNELLSVAQNNPYTLTAYGEIAGDVKYSGKLTVTATNSDGSDPLSDDDVESQGGSTSDAFIDQFQTIENTPAAMTVVIEAGRVMTGETLVSIASQTTTVIVAPAANPRIDRIVIDKLTGVYSIVAGSEAASPTAPAITVGKMPSAQILLQTSTTTITTALITDERISGSVEPSNINTTETLSNKTIGDTNTINAQDDTFTIDDAADPTLQIDFDAAGTTGTKTTVTSSQTANRVVTIPDATDTLVGKATTDTLTNKTIGDTNTINAQDDAFTIDDAADATLQIDFNADGTTGTKTTITSSQTANRVITTPDATDTLIGKATTDTLTNKTIGDTNTINAQDDAFTIDDAADATLQVGFDVAGTTGTKTTIASSQTANRTVTLPDTTDTLVTLAGTESLTNKAIDITGAFAISGTTVTSTAAEINYLDGATAGTALTTGDEGTGNGLDADTVDGLEASQFLRSDASDTTTGNITITKASPEFVSNSSSGNGHLYYKDSGTTRALLFWERAIDSVRLRQYDTDGTTVRAQITLSELGKVNIDVGTLQLAGTDVTADATELSLLDGVTSTTAELNILDGVTSTAAELNILDGVTATAAEINLVDGLTAIGDYTTGTFSPTIQDSSFSDAESQTYSVNSGDYTRIGNRVFYDLAITVTSLGSLTAGDPVYIANMPFVSHLTKQGSSAVCGSATNLSITASESVSGIITSGNFDRITVKKWSATGGVTSLLISNLTASGSVQFSGSYEV